MNVGREKKLVGRRKNVTFMGVPYRETMDINGRRVASARLWRVGKVYLDREAKYTRIREKNRIKGTK